MLNNALKYPLDAVANDPKVFKSRKNITLANAVESRVNANNATVEDNEGLSEKGWSNTSVAGSVINPASIKDVPPVTKTDCPAKRFP